MIFVSADHHFYDNNFLRFNYDRILKYGKDVNVINKCLIESQNSQVNQSDEVYYIGDLSIGDVKSTIELTKRLNGCIKLIIGNHDSFKKTGVLIPNKLEILTSGIYRLEYKNILFNLCHYPLYEQPDYYKKSIHLHGHLHGKRTGYDARAVDVGYDYNNYRLLSLDFIINKVNLN